MEDKLSMSEQDGRKLGTGNLQCYKMELDSHANTVNTKVNSQNYRSRVYSQNIVTNNIFLFAMNLGKQFSGPSGLWQQKKTCPMPISLVSQNTCRPCCLIIMSQCMN